MEYNTKLNKILNKIKKNYATVYFDQYIIIN